MNSISKHLTKGILIAMLLATASRLPAQNDTAGSDDPSTQPVMAGITVGDSPLSRDKLVLAGRMEQMKQWDAAATVYRDLLRDYSRHVVPIHADAKGLADQYAGVRSAVTERLSKWPDDGLKVYREKYERTAAELLSSAGPTDARTLEDVFSLYFITDSGRAAGMRLVDMYLESGQFAAAAWRGEMLIRRHPNLGIEFPTLLFRTAVAFDLLGDSAKARSLAEELQAKHPDAAAVVGGRFVQLADTLKAELAAGAGDTRPLASTCIRPQVRSYSIPLGPATKPTADTDKSRPRMLWNGMPPAPTSDTLGIFPVEDGGQLFFQDGQRLYAVDIQSGRPLPGWAQTHPGDRDGRYVVTGSPAPRWQPMAVAVTRDSVLAVMGLGRNMAENFGLGKLARDSDTRLVCLDRVTGKEQWVRQTRQLPASAAALRGYDFVGAPLVAGDVVIVAVRSGKGGVFDECHLLAYERAGGDFRWSCFISGASVGDPKYGMRTGAQIMSAHLAYDSGRVYVLTNLGTLGAVDAISGDIVWLSLYPPEELTADPKKSGDAPPQPKLMRPGAVDPIFLSDGKVFVWPADGTYLMIYDAESGREIKRIAMADLNNSDTLLGVAGDKLITCQGKNRVICTNWTKYALGGPSAVEWSSENFKEGIRGRGVVTLDAVVFSTTKGLVSLSIADGRLLHTYPTEGTAWDPARNSGNVLATPTHVVVAGAESLDVYTDSTKKDK